MITLSKDDNINFEGDALLPIKATLKWSENIDLDLGCFVETDQGIKVIQALDRNFGAHDVDPYVLLDKDDRSGGSETISINMAEVAHIKRVMVYAYIYPEPGHPRTFADIGEASVTINHPAEDFSIELKNGGGTICGLFELVAENGGLKLNRLEQYLNGYQNNLDEFYNWPRLSWSQGSK